MQIPAITSFLSAPAKTSGAANNSNKSESTSPQASGTAGSQSTEKQSSINASQSGPQDLSETDYRVITELKKIDRGVRAHEAAHMAAAGGLARGGASFTYTKGPDGQRYAVGGEVSIDTSPERGDPEATILKAQRIQAAALAPAQPSDADRAVAAGAAQMATAARAELAAERYNTNESTTNINGPSNNGENNAETGNEKTTSSPESRKTSQGSAEELYKIIKRATAAENSLGNLLNTAV